MMIVLSIFAILYLLLCWFANVFATGGSVKGGWAALILAFLIGACCAYSQPIRYNGISRIVQYADSMSAHKDLTMQSNKILDLGQLKFANQSLSINKAIDLSARNGGDASTWWIYLSGSNAWAEDGTLNAMRSVFRPVSSSPAVLIFPYSTSAGNTGSIGFYELVANGTNYTGFKAPDALSYNPIYTMPSDTSVVGYVLTRGAGNQLSWTNGGAGAGETNTASNLGGGVANYSTKVGVDLRFNSFSSQFSLASNLISLDTSTVGTGATTLSKNLLNAPKASPTFTGTVTLPTGLTGTLRATSGVVSATASDTVGLGTSLFAKAPKSNPTFTGDVTAESLTVIQSDNYRPTIHAENNSGSSSAPIIEIVGQGSVMFDVRANGDMYVKSSKTGLMRATAGVVSYASAIDTLSKANVFTSVSAVDTLFMFKIDKSGLTARQIYSKRKGGTSASLNVIRVRAGAAVTLRSSAIATAAAVGFLTPMESWSTLQNATTLIDDEFYLVITAISGTVTDVTTQVTFDRTIP